MLSFRYIKKNPPKEYFCFKCSKLDCKIKTHKEYIHCLPKRFKIPSKGSPKKIFIEFYKNLIIELPYYEKFVQDKWK